MATRTMPKYEDLYNAIPEAQRRQIEGNENHKRLLHEVLTHYTEHDLPSQYTANGYGDPLSMKTFGKKPLLLPKPYLNAEQAREHKIKDATRYIDYLQKQLKHYEALAVDPSASDNAIMTSTRNNLEAYKQYLSDEQQRLKDLQTQPFEDEYQKLSKKYNLTGFDKKGQPAKALVDVYKHMRGTGHYNKEGDLVAHVYKYYANNSQLRRLIRAGILARDERSGIMLIPRAVLKKINPQFKDYDAALNKFVPLYNAKNLDDIQNADEKYAEKSNFRKQYARISNAEFNNRLHVLGLSDAMYNQMIPRYNDRAKKIRDYLGRHVSFKGLNTISRSTDPYVIDKLATFFEDNADELDGTKAKEIGYKGQINSLNDIDRLKESIRQANIRRQYGERINEYMRNHPDTNKTPEEILKLFEAIDEGDFVYEPEIVEQIESVGWKLMKGPTEMKAVADGRCYGDISRYGDEYFRSYRDRIRRGETFLINTIYDEDKDPGNLTEVPADYEQGTYNGLAAPEGIHVTAQIDLRGKKTQYGNIIDSVNIVQVKGPNNAEYSHKPGIELSLDILAEELKGLPMPKNRYVLDDEIEDDNDDTPEEFGFADGGAVEDRLMQHLKAEENKLLKDVTEHNNGENVLKQEAMADGFNMNEADTIVANVMRRLQNVGTTGKKSNALFKAHKPTKRLDAIKNVLKNRVI